MQAFKRAGLCSSHSLEHSVLDPPRHPPHEHVDVNALIYDVTVQPVQTVVPLVGQHVVKVDGVKLSKLGELELDDLDGGNIYICYVRKLCGLYSRGRHNAKKNDLFKVYIKPLTS